jgi:hypothetical protein
MQERVPPRVWAERRKPPEPVAATALRIVGAVVCAYGEPSAGADAQKVGPPQRGVLAALVLRVRERTVRNPRGRHPMKQGGAR